MITCVSIMPSLWRRFASRGAGILSERPFFPARSSQHDQKSLASTIGRT